MRILAHRGGADHAPENTFAAFDLACEWAADGLEADVRATRDDVAVLMHDDSVDRTTNGAGAVAALSWDEVARLDASSAFEGRVSPQGVPRLDAFLDRYAGRLALCLEVKSADAVKPTIESIRTRGLDDRPDIELMSFEQEIVDALRAALPRMRLAGLVRGMLDDAAIAWAVSRRLVHVGPRVDQITPEQVAAAQRAGLAVQVWGIKSRDAVAHAMACGVDGITLDQLAWRPDAEARASP